MRIPDRQDTRTPRERGVQRMLGQHRQASNARHWNFMKLIGMGKAIEEESRLRAIRRTGGMEKSNDR